MWIWQVTNVGIFLGEGEEWDYRATRYYIVPVRYFDSLRITCRSTCVTEDWVVISSALLEWSRQVLTLVTNVRKRNQIDTNLFANFDIVSAQFVKSHDILQVLYLTVLLHCD